MKKFGTNVHHWQRLSLVGLPLAVVFTLMLTLPVWAATINTTASFSYSVVNPCNGEQVSVSGKYHDVGKTTLDGRGGYHFVDHENSQGTGVGSLGNKYVLTGQRNLEANGKVGVEYSDGDDFHLTSKGSAPNFLVHSTLYFTVNPDGTVTFRHDNFQAKCSG